MFFAWVRAVYWFLEGVRAFLAAFLGVLPSSENEPLSATIMKKYVNITIYKAVLMINKPPMINQSI